MRILLFNFQANKPEPAYIATAKALRKRGHEVFVAETVARLVLEWRGNSDEIIECYSCSGLPQWLQEWPIVPVLYNRWARVRILLEARSMIRRLRPNIVQICTHCWPWLLAVFMPDDIHYVLDIRQVNEAFDPDRRQYLRERRNVYSWRLWSRFPFELTFFNHTETARHVLGEEWPTLGASVPVGVDAQFLKLDSSKLARLNDTQPVSMVYVGVLSRLRTLDKLIYAADILRAETELFHLTFVGPDHTDGYLQDLVDELGLDDLITIAPAIEYDEVPGFLAKHHLGVAYVPDRPTWHYQPTIKVLEYRALGLPIFSTAVRSQVGIVQDGINGIVVDDNVASIAYGMSRVVKNREFLREIMANARRMRQGLTWDAVAELYERNYLKLSGREYMLFAA